MAVFLAALGDGVLFFRFFGECRRFARRFCRRRRCHLRHVVAGISGSYILLVIGLYGDILSAVHERDTLLLAVFAAGCGFGVLSFARLLSKMLSCWRNAVVSFLIGVMLGASPKLWPWKESAEGEKIILQANVMPADFAGDAQVLAVLLLSFVGAALVLALSAVARRS